MRRRPGSPAGPRAADETFFSPDSPRILAHRGLASEAPENTMLAFVKALSIGVQYLEIDVHASYDGVAVIAHDADLNRVAGRSLRVDQLTFAELTRIRLGHQQSFCSLTEALDAFPEARFSIDLKADAVVGPTVKAILDTAATNRVLIAAFDDRRRRAAVRDLPGVATSASSRTFGLAFAAAKLDQQSLVRHLVRNVDAVQAPERYKGVRIITPSVVDALKSAGVEVHVWTINDEVAMHKLLDMGVDGLITDRADIALRVVADRRR